MRVFLVLDKGEDKKVLKEAEQHYQEMIGVNGYWFEIDGDPKLTEVIDNETYLFSIGNNIEVEIKKEDLPDILRQSREYQEKFGGPLTQIGIPDINLRISGKLFLEALMKSQGFRDVVKPRLDVGSFILNLIRNQHNFIDWFNKNKDDIELKDLYEWIQKNNPKPDSVAVCIMGYGKVLDMILETVRTVKPHVDEIHVLGDEFSEKQIHLLKSEGCEVHIEPWKDDFSGYKNKCISYARTDWVVIFDHDEIPTSEFAANIRELIRKSNKGRNYNMIQFDAIDIKTKDGKVVSKHQSEGKPLMHVNVKDPYYANPHIWLKPNYYPWKTIKVPLAYKHVKEEGTELERSVRNVFLGGGGDNTKEGNPLWVELRKLTDKLGLDSWKKFNEYLKKGNIDPRLLDVLKRLAEMPWKDDELKDPLKYYFKLHPEEFAIVEDFKIET